VSNDDNIKETVEEEGDPEGEFYEKTVTREGDGFKEITSVIINKGNNSSGESHAL
jgi:hypothetical protein